MDRQPVMIHPLRGDSNNINMSALRSHRRSGEDDEGDSLQPPKRRGYRRHSLPAHSPNNKNHEIIFNENQSQPSDFLSSKENVLVRKDSALSTMSLPVTQVSGTMFLTQPVPKHPKQSINRELSIGSTDSARSHQHKKNLERERSIGSTNSIGSSDTLSTVKTSNTTKDQFWRSRRPSYSMGNESSTSNKKPSEYHSSSNSVTSNSVAQVSLDGLSALEVITEESNEMQDRFLQFQPNPKNNNMYRKRSSLGGNDASEIAKIDEILSERRNSSHSNSRSIPEERQPTSILEESEEIPSLVGNDGRHSSPEIPAGMPNERSSSKVHDLESLQNYDDAAKRLLMQKQNSSEHLRGDESIWSIGSASIADRNRKKKQIFNCKPPYGGVLLILLSLSLILFIITTIILAVGFQQKPRPIYVMPNNNTIPPPTSAAPRTAAPTVSPTTASPTNEFSGVNLSPIDEFIISSNITDEDASSCVEFADNGSVLAVSRDGFVRVFKKFAEEWIQIGKNIPVKSLNSTIPNPIALSKNSGNTVAVLSEQVIIVWKYDGNTKEWQQKGRIVLTDTQPSKSSIAISANGSYMAVALSFGQIHIYNYGRGDKWFLVGNLTNFESETFFSADLSDSGDRLLVGSWQETPFGNYRDHTVRVYDYNNGAWDETKTKLAINPKESMVSVSFNSDGNMFAACTIESCGVYSINEGVDQWDAIIDDLDGGDDVKLSGDGAFMLVSNRKDGAILVYRTIPPLDFSRYDRIEIGHGNQTGQSISISGSSVAVSLNKREKDEQLASLVRMYRLE